MAKRSQRRPVRYEKDQAGCIWGFISIFDFRRGQSTRRLLSDRRHPSRQVIGAGYSKPKLQMLTNTNETSEEDNDGEVRDTMIADAAKSSVKELMEEEIFSEQDQKQPVSTADTEAKESNSECRGRVKKNRKRRSKTSQSSGDLHFEPAAVESTGPENTFCQDPEEKSLQNLELEVIVNELYQQIYEKSTNCMKHDWNNEKLVKAIKVFLDQRFTDGKNLTDDREIENSKEFIKALQTSSSYKELILELLKDPNSLLSKNIGGLEDSELEKDRNSDSLARSDVLNGEKNNSKPSVPFARRNSFFRRRSKSQENIPSEGVGNCQASSRIVILKPVPAVVQISETEGKLGSSLRSHFGLGTKPQTERIASQFSFAEIKKKLKYAMGKERNGVPSDDITYRGPFEHQNSRKSDKGIGGEKSGWNSPNRNHFYNERFTRPASSNKNKDKNCKPKDIETSMETQTVEHREQRVSNIYIEAKKHLSEMLNNGDEIEDFSSTQSPKILGRIISLPDFNFSPICSPRGDKEHKFMTAQQKFSPHKNFSIVNEDSSQHTQEKNDSHLDPSRENLNSQSCISENLEYKVQSCNSDSDALDELKHADEVHDTLCSMTPEKDSEGDVAIVQTPNTLSVQEENKILDISAEHCSISVIRDGQDRDLDEICDEEESAQDSKLDTFEGDQLSSSPLTSPTSSSIVKHVGDLDSANERPERPSPVSVLEPLFAEDDISPAPVKSRLGEPPMQPLRIQFEEQPSSSASQEICVRTCMEDEESSFEYVEAVLLASDLNWEEFLSRWLSSEQILDPSLFDEVELFSNCSCHEQKLLFDCTNEVLTEVCERYFGYSPWVSFVKHNIRPIPRGKDLIDEVWEGVEWHLLPQPSPRTLDQLVRKDMARPGTWMDLRADVEGIGFEIEEAIFEELVEDAILNFLNEDPEIGSFPLLTELTEND